MSFVTNSIERSKALSVVIVTYLKRFNLSVFKALKQFKKINKI